MTRVGIFKSMVGGGGGDSPGGVWWVGIPGRTLYSEKA